jgi:xylose isomerase
MSTPRFATGLWVLGKCGDRFMLGGYGPSVPLDEQISIAASIDGIGGVECHGSDFDDFEMGRYAELCGEAGLTTTCVNTNVWGYAKFGKGAFTHRDPQVRQAAIDEGFRSCEVARKIGCDTIALWLGADGFDYPFQIDYPKHWDLLIRGIRAVAEEAAPDLRVCIEYKLKEPRTHMSISNVGITLMVLNEIGMDHVGGTIDFGHSLMSQESPAEAVCLLQRSGKLFNVHFNDAWGHWDDDMIVGTVNFWATLEFLYYCKQLDYQGWFGLDMFPYREAGRDAAQMAIENMTAMWEMLDQIDPAALATAQQSMDAVAAHRVVRKVLFR